MLPFSGLQKMVLFKRLACDGANKTRNSEANLWNPNRNQIMSNNRIINIDNGATPPPPGPTTMQELLDSAQEDWKFKRKDEAFVKVLGALAMISQGVGTAMKTSEAAHKEVVELKARLPKE